MSSQISLKLGLPDGFPVSEREGEWGERRVLFQFLSSHSHHWKSKPGRKQKRRSNYRVLCFHEMVS